MMIAVGIVIFLVLLVFVVFPSLNLKAGPRTIDTIENAIYELLRFGYDGAVLTIEFSLSGRALEFRKYANSSEDYGISFCFSRKRWTRPYFEQVLTYCKQQGLPYEIKKETTVRRKACEYLIVDGFGRDFSAAFRFVKPILLDILGLDEERRYNIYMDNASWGDKPVRNEPRA